MIRRSRWLLPALTAFAVVALVRLPVAVQAALLIAGWLGVARALRIRPPTSRRAPVLPLALILLVGFGLRVVGLESAVHQFVDEMHFVDDVVYLWQTPDAPLLLPMVGLTAFTRVYPALQAASVEIVGPSLLGMRLVSAVFGTLTIAAVYPLAAWTLRDRRAGLLAALALALFPPHIHLSRLGLNNIADPLFGTLALAALIRALRDPADARWPLLAGAALGFTQYFYEGGKLIYPALVGLVAGVAVLRGSLPRRSAGMLALAFGLVVLPLALTLAVNGERYFPRFEAAGLAAAQGQAPEFSLDDLGAALAHLVLTPDGSRLYYGGETALILPWLVPLALLGGIVLLRRGAWSLPALILLTALGSSLIAQPDWSARFVVAFPAIAVCMGAGAAWIWRYGPLARGVVLAALIAGPVYYAGPHLTTYNEQIRPWRDHQDVMFRAREFTPGTQVILLTDDLVFTPHFETLRQFWQLDITVTSLHPLDLMARPLNRLPTGGDLAIFYEPGTVELLAYLARGFDLPPPVFSPYNVPQDRQYALLWLAR